MLCCDYIKAVGQLRYCHKSKSYLSVCKMRLRCLDTIKYTIAQNSKNNGYQHGLNNQPNFQSAEIYQYIFQYTHRTNDTVFLHSLMQPDHSFSIILGQKEQNCSEQNNIKCSGYTGLTSMPQPHTTIHKRKPSHALL